jgi:hypothetical protein
MDYFVFELEVKPRPGTPEAALYAGGFTNTWVLAPDLDAARVRAVDHYADTHWLVVMVSVETRTELSHHPYLHRETWNAEDGPPPDPTQYARLLALGLGSEIFPF